MGTLWQKVGPDAMGLVPTYEGRDTQGGCCVKVGAMLPPARALLGAGREAWDHTPFPRTFGGRPLNLDMELPGCQ